MCVFNVAGSCACNIPLPAMMAAPLFPESFLWSNRRSILLRFVLQLLLSLFQFHLCTHVVLVRQLAGCEDCRRAAHPCRRIEVEAVLSSLGLHILTGTSVRYACSRPRDTREVDCPSATRASGSAGAPPVRRAVLLVGQDVADPGIKAAGTAGRARHAGATLLIECDRTYAALLRGPTRPAVQRPCT